MCVMLCLLVGVCWLCVVVYCVVSLYGICCVLCVV